MSYTISYNREIATERRRAIVDLIQYIGIGRTKILLRYFRAHPEHNFEYFQGFCGIAGVTGFPVESLWEYIHER